MERKLYYYEVIESLKHILNGKVYDKQKKFDEILKQLKNFKIIAFDKRFMLELMETKTKKRYNRLTKLLRNSEVLEIVIDTTAFENKLYVIK